MRKPIKINQETIKLCLSIAPDDWTPNDAVQAISSLGPLAPWWLPRHVLELAATDPLVDEHARQYYLRSAQTPPAIPAHAGTACILLASQSLPAHDRLGFVLPVQWVSETDRQHHLPPGLLKVADSVQKVLVERSLLLPQHQAPMQLQLPDSLASIDLSSLDWASWQSAWLPLAGALIALRSGSVCDQAVWATGAFGDDIEKVTDIDVKCAAAQRWGVRKFFYPRDSTDLPPEHDDIVFQELSYGNIPPDRRKLLSLLTPYLDALAPHDAGLQDGRLSNDDLATRYLRLNRREPADDFFIQHCVPRMADELRLKLGEQGTIPPLLVTVASNTIAVAFLTLAVLRPKQCLILYTAEDPYILKKASQLLAYGKTIEGCIPILHQIQDINNFASEAYEAVAQHCGDAASADLAYDLTPGKKEMSLDLFLDVAAHGSPMLYCRHRTMSDNWPIAFSQEFRVFSKKQMITVSEQGKRI